MDPTVIGDLELSPHPHHPGRLRVEVVNALWFGDVTRAEAQAIVAWLQAWMAEQDGPPEAPAA